MISLFQVHSFYPNSNTTPTRRMSATSSTTRLSSLQSQYYSRNNQRSAITRSGSDQHLPRVEYDYGNEMSMIMVVLSRSRSYSIRLSIRKCLPLERKIVSIQMNVKILWHQLSWSDVLGSPTTLRQQQAHTHSILKSSLKPGTISNYYTGGHTQSMGTTGTLSRRQRTVDYASDTEATCPSSQQRSTYYYYRDRSSATGNNTLQGVDTFVF